MPEQLVTPRLLSIANAAHYAGTSKATMWAWVGERLIATRKVGGRRLIEKESLDAFIDRADRTPAKNETPSSVNDPASLAEQIAREVIRLMRDGVDPPASAR